MEHSFEAQPPAQGGPRGDAAVPPSVLTARAPETEARKRGQRRQFLIGGAATVGFVTLANRPANADGGGGGACTPSLVGSVNPSRHLPPVCGNTPGCWKNHSYSYWAPGSYFMNVLVPYTHTTSLTTVFPVLTQTSGNVKFIINGSTALGSEIDASQSITISVEMANQTVVQVLNQGQLSQVVAALLNSFFFGNLYSIPSAKSFITTFFTAVYNDAMSNNSSDIATQVSSYFGNYGSVYQANNNYSELCPP